MTAAPPDLSLNPAARIEIMTIGDEGQAVIVVDDALLDADALIGCATEFAAPPEKSRYPGLVAPLPDVYRESVLAAMRPPMIDIFKVHPDFRYGSYGFFGLATVPRDRMAPGQAAPHIDSHKTASFACVHYLSRTPFGGTAFYRHKSTGFELVTPIRSDKHRHFRQTELAEREGQPLSVLNDLYDEIAYIEPVFNRLVFYRAGQLHSARMENDDRLTTDPRSGRLTANLFINLD